MRKGFTLIEMLLVVLLLGLVASLVAVNLGDKGAGAKLKIARAQLAQLRQQIDLFRLDEGRLPAQLEELWIRPEEPYFLEKAVDPWGRGFLYVVEGRRYWVGSLGEDGEAGVDDLWFPAR